MADRRSKTSAENGKKGGRPKGYAAIEAERAREFIVQRVAEELGPIVEKAIEQAKSGDKYARDWLAERGWGKVAQSLEVPEGSGELIFKWQSKS